MTIGALLFYAIMRYNINMKKIILIAIILLLVTGGVITVWIYNPFKRVPEQKVVSNFEECVKAGYPVSESYPRSCATLQGGFFTEYIGNELEKRDLIVIDNPRPNQEIQSPLTIQGQARGYWFFEASFPIQLKDENGSIIAQGIATAKTDWMTEEFVAYEANLEFQPPGSGSKGTLILKKDNPSGLPEHDDALEVPVIFK